MTQTPESSPRAAASGMRDIVKTMLFALVVAFVPRVVLCQPYTIPSASMEPTLAGGRLYRRLQVPLRLEPTFAPLQSAAGRGAALRRPTSTRRHHRLQGAQQWAKGHHQAPGRACRATPCRVSAGVLRINWPASGTHGLAVGDGQRGVRPADPGRSIQRDPAERSDLCDRQLRPPTPPPPTPASIRCRRDATS